MGKAKRITVSRLSRGAAIGGALAFLTCSVAVGARPAAAQSSLDPALAFAVLSGDTLQLDGSSNPPDTLHPTGAVGKVTLGKGAEVGSGDCLSLKKITLKKDAFVDGVCATDGGANSVVLKKGASCGGGTNTTPANSSITPLTSYQSLGATACRNPAGVDQGKLVLDENGTATITAVSGFQEFDYSKITLKKSSQLTISGPSDALVVINDAGALTLDKGSFITVNGLPANNVLVVAKNVMLKKDAELQGTIFANGTCNLHKDATVDGQLYCAKAATVGVSANVLGEPLEESVAMGDTCS
ncbi:MAG TPA: ice-binding family protein [Candidatus Binataceae bacterium]|nr:ice-binding family protein [Candidatus Binataceae bacterium]